VTGYSDYGQFMAFSLALTVGATWSNWCFRLAECS